MPIAVGLEVGSFDGSRDGFAVTGALVAASGSGQTIFEKQKVPIPQISPLLQVYNDVEH